MMSPSFANHGRHRWPSPSPRSQTSRQARGARRAAAGSWSCSTRESPGTPGRPGSSPSTRGPAAAGRPCRCVRCCACTSPRSPSSSPTRAPRTRCGTRPPCAPSWAAATPCPTPPPVVLLRARLGARPDGPGGHRDGRHAAPAQQPGGHEAGAARLVNPQRGPREAPHPGRDVRVGVAGERPGLGLAGLDHQGADGRRPGVRVDSEHGRIPEHGGLPSLGAPPAPVLRGKRHCRDCWPRPAGGSRREAPGPVVRVISSRVHIATPSPASTSRLQQYGCGGPRAEAWTSLRGQ